MQIIVCSRSGAALLIVAVDRHPFPNTVEVIGIAAGERINRGAIGGVNDENAADRRLAVVRHQRARGHYVDRMFLGTVEMDAMIAIMFGAGWQNVFFIERMDHVQHGASLIPTYSVGEGVFYLSKATEDRLIPPP